MNVKAATQSWYYKPITVLSVTPFDRVIWYQDNLTTHRLGNGNFQGRPPQSDTARVHSLRTDCAKYNFTP